MQTIVLHQPVPNPAAVVSPTASKARHVQAFSPLSTPVFKLEVPKYDGAASKLRK